MRRLIEYLSVFIYSVFIQLHKTAMRKIIHIDADCFYAAIEVRDNPQLAGRPVAVGGDPGRRGVIATCSYEARKHGVHSAMASVTAKRLCPELEIIKPNIRKYKQVSHGLMSILAEYSETCEPLSLDEAFLDVSTSAARGGSATLIAKEIKQRVHSELGVTVSAGVAPVKFLSKVASDWLKPNGLFVILPNQVEQFTADLKVGRLPGVGPVTVEKLHRHGLYLCRDIRAFGMIKMAQNFGAFGEELFRRAWGRDDRCVSSSRERKSVSVERTFTEDMDARDLPSLTPSLLKELNHRLSKSGCGGRIKKVVVKVKFEDFTQTTMETNLSRFIKEPWVRWLQSIENGHGNQVAPGILDTYQRLIHAAWGREKRPVRLLGVGVGLSSNPQSSDTQLPLSEDW